MEVLVDDNMNNLGNAHVHVKASLQVEQDNTIGGNLEKSSADKIIPACIYFCMHAMKTDNINLSKLLQTVNTPLILGL